MAGPNSPPTPNRADNLNRASATIDVWLVAWPGIQALDLTGPHEVFAAANQVLDGLGRPGARYRLRVVARHGTEVVSESGLRLGCDPISDVVGAPHTLMLPGGDGVHVASEDAELVAQVARLGDQASRVATVCTGTFLAAAAGLIDGRRVATHWARAERLARTYPGVTVDADALHVEDGRIWSSAGVTAGIDLALALVEKDHDAEVAQITGRWLVVHLRRPGGQSQFAAPVWNDPSPLEPVRAAQEAVHADPGADHSVAVLADRVGLSSRHFTRLFTSDVGESPARFVQRVRIERARHELEAGVDLQVVAKRCGFGTTETLRRAFHRSMGLAPDEYRRRFRLSAG